MAPPKNSPDPARDWRKFTIVCKLKDIINRHMPTQGDETTCSALLHPMVENLLREEERLSSRSSGNPKRSKRRRRGGAKAPASPTATTPAPSET